MSREVRNIYPGECLFLNDTQVLRVQTFGASTTLNSEDVNELGNLEIVEIVDNVPAVAITLDTFCHGSIATVALLAGKDPLNTRYVRAADFESASVDIYAPIIQGADYGKTNTEAAAGTLDIYRTMYIDNAFVNSQTMTFNTTAIATENYAMESDNKAWYFNDGASVVRGQVNISTGDTDYDTSELTLDSGKTADDDTLMTQLNDGSYTLATDLDQQKIIKVIDATDGFTVLKELTSAGSVANGAGDPAGFVAGQFYIEQHLSIERPTGNPVGETIHIHTDDAVTYDTEILDVRYIAKKGGAYFSPDASFISGLRLGQTQIYLAPFLSGTTKIDPADEIFWRMISSTITVTLTREPLLELGHFRPYSRPLTFPIPVTVASEATDADTEMFAKLCGKDFDTDTEISIDDLLKDQNLIVKLYRYTDVQRRKIAAALVNDGGKNITGFNVSDTSFDEDTCDLPAYGGAGIDDSVTVGSETYYTHDLAPLLTIVVKRLIPTGENQNLAIGGNATQTFDFRADNATVGIGGANELCIGSYGTNQGAGVDTSEIVAGAHGWQAFKYSGTDADI